MSLGQGELHVCVLTRARVCGNGVERHGYWPNNQHIRCTHLLPSTVTHGFFCKAPKRREPYLNQTDSLQDLAGKMEVMASLETGRNCSKLEDVGRTPIGKN